jgi:hypothetical protein
MLGLIKMKSLYDVLVGNKNEELQTASEKSKESEQFIIISKSEDQYLQINQIHRKIKILNEFKKYIENADIDSVYYNYILNTLIYEQSNKRKEIYIILPGFFSGLSECRTTEHPDDFLRILVNL